MVRLEPAMDGSALPAEMRALVYRAPRKLDVATRALPTCGTEDVLLAVSHCGICGTDLHMVLEGMGRPDSIGGHEFAGVVAAVGEAVEGWAIGDRALPNASASDCDCSFCRAGRPSLCRERPDLMSGDSESGAFAEYIRVRGDALLRVPEGLSLRAAALTEPLAVALHAISRGGIGPGQRVLVTGAGPIGLLCIAALRAAGVDDVVASEPHALRAQRAAQVGAREVRAPEDLAVPKMPFHEVDAPFDAVLECSGRPEAMTAGLAQLRRAGTLVLVGTGMARPKLDHNRVLLCELVVTGAFNYDGGGFERALDLLASGTLPLAELIEPVDVRLEEMLRAAEDLAGGRLAGKVMVVPGA